MVANNAGIYELRGVVRNYDWGGVDFIPALLSTPNPEKKPVAEYWLGAHDSASSLLKIDSDAIPLNEFIASDKEKILGKVVSKKFGRLPFLLKILDVREMLSIQVHPSKHTAEIEFARENSERIPLNAPHRNYKDDNHKPELMVALSDFWLLHGFKPVDKLRTTLATVPELRPLLKIFDDGGYDQLYKTVMEMPQVSVNQILGPLLTRIVAAYEKKQLSRQSEDFWAARAAIIFGAPQETIDRVHPADRGIFSIYFFNLLQLWPGEGIFQDAGVPHAYLEGQNVELMANSDNVLRGGLTTKHIDVKELMKNIKFEETIPGILQPQRMGEGQELYRTAAPDFTLSRFRLKQNETSSFRSATGEVLLMLKGKARISTRTHALQLRGGESAFVVSQQNVAIAAEEDTDIFRAHAPVHTGE